MLFMTMNNDYRIFYVEFVDCEKKLASKTLFKIIKTLSSMFIFIL